MDERIGEGREGGREGERAGAPREMMGLTERRGWINS